MPETRFITSRCDKCQQANNISLKYFVELNYEIKNAVIATFQKCNTDFIATLDESEIKSIFLRFHES